MKRFRVLYTKVGTIKKQFQKVVKAMSEAQAEDFVKRTYGPCTVVLVVPEN